MSETADEYDYFSKRSRTNSNPAFDSYLNNFVLGWLLESEINLTESELSLNPRDTAELAGEPSSPIAAISRFRKILAGEKSCEEGWDGEGEWACFPECTPFAHHLISIAEAEYKPFVLGNARALQSKKKVFDITTYGEKTTYLTRDYPERSREMLKRFSYDVLTNSGLAIADSWLAKTDLAEIFIS